MQSGVSILLFCPVFPYPESDGVSFTIMETVRRLFLAGVSVTVLGMHPPEHTPDLKRLPENIKRLADFVSVEINLQITPIERYANFFFDNASLEMNQYFSEGTNRVLMDILDREKFDIIQIEDIRLTKYLPAIRTKHLGKVILRLHNLLSATLPVGRSSKISQAIAKENKKRVQERENKILLSGEVEEIIAINDTLQSTILALFHQAQTLKVPWLKIIPVQTLCVGWEIEVPEITTRTQGIIYTGTLDYPKNLKSFERFLKNIWIPIHNLYPNITLHVAVRSAPASLIENLKGCGGVIEGDIADYYGFLSSKTIMVVPMYEPDGWQKRVWEGMSAGCALVVSPQALAGIPATHGEHLFIAKGEAEFARYIGTLIEHENIAHTLGVHARRFAIQNGKGESGANNRLYQYYQKLSQY